LGHLEILWDVIIGSAVSNEDNRGIHYVVVKSHGEHHRSTKVWPKDPTSMSVQSNYTVYYYMMLWQIIPSEFHKLAHLENTVVQKVLDTIFMSFPILRIIVRVGCYSFYTILLS
jgi:hypothetical protein